MTHNDDLLDLMQSGDEMQQRAEAAEARAAQGAERAADLLKENRNLSETIVTLRAQLEQAQREIAAFEKFNRALNQILNECDGAYRP